MNSDILIILASLAIQGPSTGNDARSLVNDRNAIYAAGGLALAGGSYLAVDDLKDELDGSWVMGGPADLTDVYGSSNFNLPVSLGMWAAGRARSDVGVEKLGRNLTRALTLTQLTVGPIKLATRRRRPDGSNRLSFPSGHTANAFAIARLIQREYGNRYAVPLYVVAGYTAAGRMEDARHYTSDVVMGAAIGMIVGSSINTTRTAGRFSVDPQVTKGGWLLRGVFSF